MDVTFLNPGAEDMIEQIMAFQTETESAFWSDPLYHFYPQLDRNVANALPFHRRMRYIEDTMRSVYTEKENLINKKVSQYAGWWGKCRLQVNAALSDAFEVDCAVLFNDVRCHVSLNPIEPRFLKERRYDTFYLNDEKGAIGNGIHELIHFAWFYVWNRVFLDDDREYEAPSLKWILSEMVVESIMKDARLSTINPRFPRENGGCIYPYFFDMKVDGTSILETLDQMYQSQRIVTFMKNSFAYCREHEAEIRNHIEKAERQE